MATVHPYQPKHITPTDEQVAVQMSAERTLIIEANAGAAKTTTLALRMAQAWTTGMPPERCLALTYTDTACQALQAALRKIGLPADLVSCHTALIDGVAFEGHVPVADMKRVLASKPKGVKGLAVAGMPLGSPGMEVPGQKPQPFVVYSFGAAGQKIYARH